MGAHDYAVDWWGLGVLTFELITGDEPFDDQGVGADEDVMAHIHGIRKSQDRGPNERLLPNQILTKDFIRQLLAVNEDKRLGTNGSGQEIRNHAWFSFGKFDFEALKTGSMKAP